MSTRKETEKYPEHDTGDTENDGDETGIIDWEILRIHCRSNKRLHRRRLPWIIRLCRHLLTDSQSLDDSASI